MKRSLIICALLLSAPSWSQWSVGGYLKYMPSQTYLNEGLLNSMTNLPFPAAYDDHLLHNRINLNWYSQANEYGNFSFEMGLRNRVFYGFQASQPGFASSLELDPGLFDMRWLWNDPNDEVLFHSEIDRLNVGFSKGDFSMRMGRQRINWGIHDVFNPNDIFNQYNYFDFDYEERPGADAVWIQQYLGDGFSAVELAFSPDIDNPGRSTGVALFKSNYRGYDYQVLAGYSFYDLVVGGGWAGSIGGAGFKGEAAYYHSTDPIRSESNFTMSLGGDYLFSNGIYASASVLYNGLGALEPTLFDQLQLRQTRLSSKNIFPYRWTVMLSTSYTLNPLWSVNLAWFQSHAFDQAALIPSITYSLSSNLDAMLLAQIFSVRALSGDMTLFTSAVYGRVKWSF